MEVVDGCGECCMNIPCGVPSGWFAPLMKIGLGANNWEACIPLAHTWGIAPLNCHGANWTACPAVYKKLNRKLVIWPKKTTYRFRGIRICAPVMDW